MAYQNTEVPVARSQEGIRRLLRDHGGFSFAAVSQDDPTGEHGGIEGFEAQIMLDAQPYRIRVLANVPKCPERSNRVYRGSAGLTAKQKNDFRERAEKRIWRVLFYHIKAMFEAADAGVLEFRELMLPYLVIPKTNRTIGKELLTGSIQQMLVATPQRLLGAGS